MNKPQNRSFVYLLHAAALAGASGFSAIAGAAPVCYEWTSPFERERFVLDIQYHSRLKGNQRAFSVHGKHVGVCGYETIATVTGTIVTAFPAQFSADGSHMGLRTHSVRSTNGSSDAPQMYCKEVTLDCSSPSRSPDPQTWTCISRNEWDRFHLFGPTPGHQSPTSTLTKLSPWDGFCRIFQDTGQNGGIPFSPDDGDVPVGDFSGFK